MNHAGGEAGASPPCEFSGVNPPVLGAVVVARGRCGPSCRNPVRIDSVVRHVRRSYWHMNLGVSARLATAGLGLVLGAGSAWAETVREQSQQIVEVRGFASL